MLVDVWEVEIDWSDVTETEAFREADKSVLRLQEKVNVGVREGLRTVGECEWVPVSFERDVENVIVASSLNVCVSDKVSSWVHDIVNESERESDSEEVKDRVSDNDDVAEALISSDKEKVTD